MSILVFCKNRVDKKLLDDGEGHGVSLEMHLYYLKNSGGTPDCSDIIEEDELEEHRDSDYVYVDEYTHEEV